MHPFSDLSGACQKKGDAIIQPHTPSNMVWQVLLLETFKTAFVCLLIYCNETVHCVLMCCLAVGYIQYKMVSFPQENVQSVQFVDVSSLPECCLRGDLFYRHNLSYHDLSSTDTTYSGSKWCLGGNTQAPRKHLQTVQTVHFLEGKTPFCTVCTQWRSNTLAQTK